MSCGAIIKHKFLLHLTRGQDGVGRVVVSAWSSRVQREVSLAWGPVACLMSNVDKQIQDCHGSHLWFRHICETEQRETVLWEYQCKIIIIAYYIIQLLKYFLCCSRNKACTWIEKIEEMGITVFSSCLFPRKRKLLWSLRPWGISFISLLSCKRLGAAPNFVHFITGPSTVSSHSTELILCYRIYHDASWIPQ